MSKYKFLIGIHSFIIVAYSILLMYDIATKDWFWIPVDVLFVLASSAYAYMFTQKLKDERRRTC